MMLVEFMNTHEDWMSLLAAEPYCLEIKKDTIKGVDYYLLKYNMILSDFSLPEVLEARGAIFRQDDAQEWICVCHPFDKFFNYGEKYSAVGAIDWDTARVMEKIDGSLIKLWFDAGEWHISTNGTIDAFKASCGDSTFGDVFMSILGQNDFFSVLRSRYNYMFEMVAPAYNHIVVRYPENKIYFLGCRDMVSDEETLEQDIDMAQYGIEFPKVFPHYSLAACIEACHNMGIDEEGYVVVDDEFNRIKIKGDEYLRLHRIRGNGPLTALRVIEMWQAEALDDFVAYYPEYQEFVNKVLHCVNHYVQVADIAYSTISGYPDVIERKDFARYANSYIPPISSFLYARLDEKVHNAYQYFYTMRARSLASFVLRDNAIGSIGNDED